MSNKQVVSIDSFRKKREAIVKAEGAYSDTYREGKGSMADKPSMSLLDSTKQKAFLDRF
ncbi:MULTISPECIES: hypothetical protein [unclassified Sulfurimonas]|uniref:hypothetical protein n=1 Tax=unclassified Sulfurimonas TaxID=2623549 RepID=UPI0025F91866|nr:MULTISPECIES: hypothetical protein [unclassified Sulfurimonas]